MLIGCSFWAKSLRSGRFICLIIMMFFGCFSITTANLLVRSLKKTEIEESLTITGDYDGIIYEANLGIENYLIDSEIIDEIGVYYELGVVENIDETSSFKAVAFKDELSEEIYHMNCIRGEFPNCDNEIAIDISVANAYGIAPYPGESICLKLYDYTGNIIGTREYIVSGVFRASSNEAAGGWYRNPDFNFIVDSYQMPAVFFFSSNLDTWGCSQETVFFRSYSIGEEELYSKIPRLLEDTNQRYTRLEYNGRRSSGYTWYIGLDEGNVNGHYGYLSWENIHKAVLDGLYKRDFYSAIIIPIISIMVITTEIVSLYMLSQSIIADRKEIYATLRSIGMTSKRIIANILAEFLGVVLGGAVVGISLGYVVHILLINYLNNSLHLRLYYGIHVDQIVRKITYDPIITSLFVCLFSLLVSLIIPLYRLYKMYPAELLSVSDRMFVEKKKSCNRNKTNIKKGWLGLLTRRIDLHDSCTMVVMMIVLSSILFGYVFFRAFSEQATSTSRGFMEMLGIDGNGYVVTRSSELSDWSYNVSNRHDAGIVPSFPELVENNPQVERSWSVIFNESTRMVFTDEPDEVTKQLLGNRLLNIRPSDDPFVIDSLIAEEIIFEHTGYDSYTYMYELPTVGLTVGEMIDLEGDLVAGHIDIEKIRNGEELVLAVPVELQDICLQRYPIGSRLCFDDIVLTDEEENLDFNRLNDSRWVIYDNYIETEVGETYVSYGAFGRRHEIESRVGAIVALHSEQDIREYLSTGSNWVHQLYYQSDFACNAEPTYGISVLCLADSFNSWGLPDRNFTSVKVILTEDCDIYQFDEFWYKALSGSQNIETKSTYDYLDDIYIGSNRVMTVFFVLVIVLVLLGFISIVSGLYTKMRVNLLRFQTLRCIGLSVNQACTLVYCQNMFYPIIGTLIAIIPISLMQAVFNNVFNKLQTGELDPSFFRQTPWYSRIPYWANLFSYNFVPALLCCLMLGNFLIIIGTLPQIMCLRKMTVIETREE